MRLYKSSSVMSELMGEVVHKRYYELKQSSAERCPAALGTSIKTPEIMFHHEVTNQFLWTMF
jgi:glutamine synthetase